MTNEKSSPDSSMDAAISRLTPKELECLDRWLENATAKEIGRDLGISHHAVEKRLRSARTKIGVSSSREAARIASRRKDYCPAASHLPDMSQPAKMASEKSHRANYLGVLAMITLISIATGVSAIVIGGAPEDLRSGLVEVPVGQHSQSLDNQADRGAIRFSHDQVRFDPATEAEVTEWLGFIFRTTDRNSSGFIEINEAPRTFVLNEVMGQTVITGESAQEAFIESHDRDANGLVDEFEFVAATKAKFLKRGIPRLTSSSKATN